MAIGGAILSAIVAARGRPWGLTVGHVLLAALAGLLFSGDLVFWHRSIAFVGPGLATILVNLQVIVLAVFGMVMLRERAARRLLVAIPSAVVGLFLIFGRDWDQLGSEYHWGVVFGLLAAVAYASYLLVLRGARRRAGEGVEALATVATLSLVSAVVLGGLVHLEGETFAIPNVRTFGMLVAYAVLIQVVAWVVISGALPRVPASRAGLLLLLQPTLAFVWDILLFDRPTSAVELIGAALALGAIYLGLTSAGPQHPPPVGTQQS
jgi:drug/metabolite transporter (DMT)-like permease